jgi:replicative DNA helicase
MSLENVEAEQGLIGALLSNNSLLPRMTFFESAHLFEPVHQRIFTAIEAAHKAGRMATPLTLKPLFDADPALADIGGGRYLNKLAATSNHVIDPVELAQHITGLAQRRALLAAIEEAKAKLAEASDEESSDLVQTLCAKFESIGRGFDGPLFETSQQVGERILKNMFHTQKPHSTGLARLDAAMDGGLFPGKSYGFAGKKKHGKTILAGTISENLNRQGVKHLFICAEMGPDEIHQRTLARQTGSYASVFRSEHGKEDWFQKKAGDAVARDNACTIFHNAPGMTFEQLRKVVLTAIYKHHIKGFILDYWQLVKGWGKSQNPTDHYDLVAQWIADTGRKYGVWTITTAQINREGDTRGGDGIRLAFDQVYQIQRPDLGLPGTWLEMMDTRYTKWADVGDENDPGLLMSEKGTHFEEAA